MAAHPPRLAYRQADEREGNQPRDVVNGFVKGSSYGPRKVELVHLGQCVVALLDGLLVPPSAFGTPEMEVEINEKSAGNEHPAEVEQNSCDFVCNHAPRNDSLTRCRCYCVHRAIL